MLQMPQRQSVDNPFKHKSFTCLKATWPFHLSSSCAHTQTHTTTKANILPTQPHLQSALHLVQFDNLEKIPFRHTLIPINLLASASTHKPLTLSPTPSCLGALSIIPPPPPTPSSPRLPRGSRSFQLNKHSSHASRQLESGLVCFPSLFKFCLHVCFCWYKVLWECWGEWPQVLDH